MPDILAHVNSRSGTTFQKNWAIIPDMTKKTSSYNEATGDRLRLCREFLELTQEGFAADLGVSRTVLENWESGDNCPKPVAIERVRTKYGITHDWVFGANAYLLPDDMKKAVAAPRGVEATAPQRPTKRRKSA